LKLKKLKVKRKEAINTLNAIEVGCPVIKEAYEKLGEDVFTRTRYSKKKIEAELLKLQGVKDPNVIRNLLKLEVGSRYALDDLKKKITNLPTEFKPTKKSASAIESYYAVKRVRFMRGKEKVNGYIILGVK
jgi:hypothetical protein